MLKVWLADAERFSSVVVDFNHNLKRRDAMLLSDPYDFQRLNRSEIYLQRVFELLREHWPRPRQAPFSGQLQQAEGVS